MATSGTHPELRGLHWTALLLTALSLSIGWGIRGNFGHEYGAMIPGALAALAACLMSGRADWRARAPYFALFGALGWAFGASISYMQVIAYAHSGHAATQYYGFFCLFVIGFLWGGMGGAGTAFPAVADRATLTAFFKPLCWVFGVWVATAPVLVAIEVWSDSHLDSMLRQESPLYWFDADWIPALTALFAIFLCERWERRAQRGGQLPAGAGAAIGIAAGILAGLAAVIAGLRLDIGPDWFQPVLTCLVTSALLALVLGALGALGGWIRLGGPLLFGVSGAAVGFVLQQFLVFSHLWDLLKQWLLQYQCDMAQVRAAAEATGTPIEQLLREYVINWPQFFNDIPWIAGPVLGLVAGVCLYFAVFGAFRKESSLILYMAGGWLIAFLIFPTLLGFGGAGFRMTPPRGDDWAGIVGVFAGTMIWLFRHRLVPVAWVALLSATIGGLGFTGAAWLRLMLGRPGNPDAGASPESVAAWAHWQSANWHSFLEQSYGFINGIGIAVAMGLLATRVGRVREDAEPRRRWTSVFAVAFVLFGITFLNSFKNVAEWVGKKHVVPEKMTMPLFESVTLPAAGWFCLVWLLMAVMFTWLLVRHQRQPIAVVPPSALGKGQLLYIAFLWMMVIANFERALPGFEAGRILTEGTIFVNAILATAAILVWPRGETLVAERGQYDYGRDFGKALLGFAAALLIAVAGMTATVRWVYDGHFCGHAAKHIRFGADASWRVEPIEKGKQHL